MRYDPLTEAVYPKRNSTAKRPSRRTVDALVVWVVLSRFDYEGDTIKAVFRDEAEADRWAQAQDTVTGQRMVVEGWKVDRPHNAPGERPETRSEDV